jgi:hypothetical protein
MLKQLMLRLYGKASSGAKAGASAADCCREAGGVSDALVKAFCNILTDKVGREEGGREKGGLL